MLQVASIATGGKQDLYSYHCTFKEDIEVLLFMSLSTNGDFSSACPVYANNRKHTHKHLKSKLLYKRIQVGKME